MKTRHVLWAAPVFMLGMLACGCKSAPRDEFRSRDRAAELMRMAAEEAAGIESARERLTRQLNIADLQNDQKRYADAEQTLRQAAETITRSADQLDMETRLAGWVSISELARVGGRTAPAGEACDKALALLRSVQPLADRCQYVRSVAQELRRLRGAPAAAEVLRESGQWAGEIPAEGQRRQAYAAIASDLFLCNDYEGGRAMLHRDTDAAWRADTLTALARSAIPIESYGRSLGFSKVFYIGIHK